LRDEPATDGPRVRIFVMGANRWRDEEEWPLERAVSTRWHLREGGGLSRESPGEEVPDEFVYDPFDPVPTIGGQTLMPGAGFFQGPRDRREIAERSDVLTYTSAALTEDVEVTGPVTMVLYVATSCRDTDFTAALVDVHPDGRAIGLTDGILRLRYRDGLDRSVLAEPGKVYEIAIDLVATSNLFKAGHRIRIEVSSSNFPRFDRNPNHGGVIAEAVADDFRPAHQRVFHDPRRPSHVVIAEVDARRR